MVIAGELSLTGEIRQVRRLASRIRASRGIGFTDFLAPPGEEGALAAKDIKTAIRLLFSAEPAQQPESSAKNAQ
jgi:predicted ATP-dependent serine protease